MTTSMETAVSLDPAVDASPNPFLPHPVFDADNHYYEALDAFTRYLDPAWGPRTIQWAQIDGRQYHVLGGRISRAVVNPTFDPVAKPGVLRDYFRGNPNGDDPIELLRARDRISPAYRDRDARIAQLDDHGLERIWLFPTLGMVYEALLANDPEAVTVLFSAFNRWIADDWGFDYQGRIFAAPYMTLVDVDWAVRELEWALDAGARTVVFRPAAPTTRLGPRPPTAPEFDPFKRHIWINPFWEDDVHELLDLMGPDRVIFGSDWPHIEGMPRPLDYLEEIDGLAPDVIRKIMLDNAAGLTERHPI